MTPENLAYYMRGVVEHLNDPPTREQWGAIRHTIMAATTDVVYMHFGGETPPELATLLSQGCTDCKPGASGKALPPTLDESKLPTL